MDVTAQLIGTYRLPGGGTLVDGFHALGPGGARRLLLRRGHDLEVHDLAGLLAGERAPDAVFPVPWPGWNHGVHAVAPDAGFAVFSGQRAVRAVDADGRTLWEHRHDCWGPLLGHPHTGDDQQVCDGLEHGSVHVSADGRLVWAHVVGDDGERGRTESWRVLDARDGREIDRIPLDDSVAAGSHQLPLSDGIHVALSVGMGQDGCLLYWARREDGASVVRDLNEGLDRILLDVHPDRGRLLTVEHYGTDLQLHGLDGTLLAEAVPTGPGPDRWDWYAGFADADTVIGSTGHDYGDDDPVRHWLLDGHLTPLGPVVYPAPVTGYARGLGDGTWLTHDRESDTLSRWTRAGS
ncbi:hypothetical protein ACFVU3_16770 [Streptomyces sp. NPDC058052]|uniref:hypothetical protein n=1 Tax=Streptomyces sp. NPDC058052 TaxID=3346316 RepID=UPI0036E2E661